MTRAEQKKAVKKFIQNWSGHGYEKGESQKFWLDLLCNVFGVQDFANFVYFENQIKDKIQDKTITNFIDAYIPSTRVMIEQKSSGKNLREPIKQSDGTQLTPFQQAKKYIAGLPLSQHPRWVVTCNFSEFLVYDMENPGGEPESIKLENLEKEYYRLQFLVESKNEKIRREEEISMQAGELVGKLYDAIFKEYINPDENSLRSLNILCVRLVFCFYAEDAGLFETKSSFEDYIKSFSIENLRAGIVALFKALDTKIEGRDKYEAKLKPFPYVNGGLFRDETIEIPNFTQDIVDVMVNHCAPFNWSEISPTIFGAVFESTLNPETRRSGGMHYTSIENIHKVIDPLFMDDLTAEFEEITGLPARHVEEKNTVIEPVEMTNSANGGFDRLNHRTINVRLSKKLAEKLLAFQKKLGSLTFLDPACGSGNFLTETYLSLRRLENRVISILNKGERVFGFDEFIRVKISQFYGIEINDFAVTVAKTALWIAESQMVAETEAIVSQTIDFLPLTTNAFIVEGNALRMDWSTLQTADELDETPLFKAETTHIYKVDDLERPLVVSDSAADGAKRFKDLNIITKNVVYENPKEKKQGESVVYDYIMGNPPFVGYGLQNTRQKEDTLLTYTDEKGKQYKAAGKIDYVANWYFKAAQLVQGKKTKVAFVSTNSITQGEQVASVWKPLFERFGIHIDFAYQTFRWQNETPDKAHMAAVHCVIVGFSHGEVKEGHTDSELLRNSSSANKESRVSVGNSNQCGNKKIFNSDGTFTVAKNINPYLLDAPNVFIESRAKPLCAVPLMTTGNRPADGGHLIIEADEYKEFIKKEPGAKKFIKRILGSEEFINGKERYCLWLVGANPAELLKLPRVMKRVEACRKDREASPDAGRQKLALTPTLFREQLNPESYIIVPRVSSERRQYIPIGFLGDDVIPTDSATIIPNATLYDFGILTSSVHMAWMRAVCGRLKSDYRYSKDIVYNNFPWPEPAEALKTKIEQTAQTILDARANYPDCTLAQLYGENAYLFPDLRRAHQENDKAVMKAYGFSAKLSESEIVSELFKLYESLSKSPNRKV